MSLAAPRGGGRGLRVPALVRPLLISCGLIVLASTLPLAAQSCILTRLDSPVLSVFDPLAKDQKWEVSFAWRYGHSDRHFVGTDEQEYRQAEGSEVVNDVHLADVAVRYQFTPRLSLEIGAPYLMAERSGPIRDGDRNLVGRELRSSTRGLGDVTAVAHRLVWDPELHPRSNLEIGLGIKLPTGENAMLGTRTRYVDGEPVRMVQTADQSVQPGDGGFGLVVGVSGFKRLDRRGALAGYVSATYIVAPEGTSGVPTYRSAPGEEVMSITDQYVARLGIEAAPARWGGFGVGIGGRIEGIPVRDLMGSSDGFRRPGYILSVEPSFSYTRKAHRVILAIPVAVERNRQRSVADLANGRHGDAAFPDYLVLAGYSYRF